MLVVLQAVFLLSWAGYHEWVRQQAPTVRLKTIPVDPRDLLRGDYMILTYEVSRHSLPHQWTSRSHPVFVVLKNHESRQVIDEVLLTEPPSTDARLWVRAEGEGDPGDSSPRALRLTYGIEQFFVPEGKGTPSFRDLEVEASISPSHRLQIKQVRLDGKRFP